METYASLKFSGEYIDQFQDDRQLVVLKPENRLAEVVIGLILMFAIAVLLRFSRRSVHDRLARGDLSIPARNSERLESRLGSAALTPFVDRRCRVLLAASGCVSTAGGGAAWLDQG